MVKYGGRVLAIAVVMSVTAIPPAPGRHTCPCRVLGLRSHRGRGSPWARLAAGPRDADVGIVIRFHQRLHH